MVILGAWGSQSEKAAMKSWVSESAYVANNKTLINDAKHSATALRTKSAPTSELHTVCAVMLVESEEANSALPTPDHLASSLLAKAYGNLGAGANVCYKAGANSNQAHSSDQRPLTRGRAVGRGLRAHQKRSDDLTRGGTKVNLESQDAVFEGGRGVTQHGEVLEVESWPRP